MVSTHSIILTNLVMSDRPHAGEKKRSPGLGRKERTMNKKAMYSISYGLFVLTTRVGDRDNGCITNTVAQVTSEPNRVSVAVNKANYTCEMIKELPV